MVILLNYLFGGEQLADARKVRLPELVLAVLGDLGPRDDVLLGLLRNLGQLGVVREYLFVHIGDLAVDQTRSHVLVEDGDGVMMDCFGHHIERLAFELVFERLVEHRVYFEVVQVGYLVLAIESGNEKVSEGAELDYLEYKVGVDAEWRPVVGRIFWVHEVLEGFPKDRAVGTHPDFGVELFELGFRFKLYTLNYFLVFAY